MQSIFIVLEIFHAFPYSSFHTLLAPGNQWLLYCLHRSAFSRGHMGSLVIKNLPANARDLRDMGSTPGWGKSPQGDHGNPLQYACLKNPMDRLQSMGPHRVGRNWSDFACTQAI